MNSAVLIIVTIIGWSAIVARVLSQKGVSREKHLMWGGVFGFSTPDRLYHHKDFSFIGLFFYILVTPVILGTQIVLRAGELIIGKIEDLCESTQRVKAKGCEAKSDEKM